MTGTLINESNSQLFLSAIPEDILPFCDIRIGVVDEETDTACGVLAAEAIGNHILAIRYIYVDKFFRLEGAGKELVKTLIELAEEIEAETIVCSYSRENLSDGIVELLESCGFVRNDEMTEPILGVYLSKVSFPGDVSKGIKSAGVTIKALSTIDDKKWQIGGIVWERNNGPANGQIAFSDKPDSFDQELSFVALDKNEDIVGLLLGVRSGKGYELLILSAFGERTPGILLALIEHSMEVARQQLDEDDMVIIRPLQKQSQGLLEHLTGGDYITLGETVQYSYEVLI